MSRLIFNKTDTPVVVVNCKLAALGIMRSLGPLGIPLYGVDADPHSPAMRSRYCKERFITDLNDNNPEQLLDTLLDVAKYIGRPSILIPTSDETALFVSDYHEPLSRHFIFPFNQPAMVRRLISKKEMYDLAKQYRIPTPNTSFPKNLDDVKSYATGGAFPVMLKGIHGNRLQTRTTMKMVIVHTREELIEFYQSMEDKEAPNLMLQEYIPGGDDQVYIFNGYFNNRSDCLAAFTGRKIRQFPIHVGCASLGEARWNEEVSRMTQTFMKAMNYRGILDIGYRWDSRDGRYKVLDINPRVGQAFRLFVAENDMDVVKSLYLDLTDQKQPQITPREGRRWLIEDLDIISTLHYFQEGSLTLSDWLRSLRRIEEGAWFSWKDPKPFFLMLIGFFRRLAAWLVKTHN